MAAKEFLGLGITALKSNFTALGEPYKLNFAITYRCQSRCKTCNIWQTKPSGELTLEEITRFAEKNPSFRWITITGGEPFLRSDIVEIIDAFRRNSRGLYLVTIPTNSLSSRELVLGKVEEIMKLGIPKLSITLSLDGGRGLHDEMRGVPGAFDRVMALAKGLRELQKRYPGLYFVFGYTISRYNVGRLEDTYEAVRKEIPEVNWNNFHVNVAHTSEIYYSNLNMDLKTESAAIARELRGFVRKRGVGANALDAVESVFLRNLVKYVETGKAPMRSRSLDASLFVDSNGNVFPSIMWAKKLGNLRDTGYDLRPIWTGEQAAEARKLLRKGEEPVSWTACEAYQAIVGDLPSFVSLFLPV
jgi:MoaA/NifB/PqqE/SkfB family radical SAM enzyme